MTLTVTFLKSWARSGMFNVSCLEGCTCETLKVDGHATEAEWQQNKISQAATKFVQVSAAGACMKGAQ